MDEDWLATTRGATLAILAGGSSTRLGVTSKALASIGGRTFVEMLAGNLGPLFGEVLVSARDAAQARAIEAMPLPPGARVVPDLDGPRAVPAGAGPIRGVQSILESALLPHVFLVSVDMPLVPPVVAGVLAMALAAHPDAGAIVPRWGIGYLEPTLAIYKVEMARVAVDEAIVAGAWQLVQVIRRIPGVVFLPVEAIRRVDPPLACMVNVNDAVDLAEAGALLGPGAGEP